MSDATMPAIRVTEEHREKASRLFHEKAEPVALPVSLRDYFAAAALQGLIACPTTDGAHPMGFANDAYRMADAMLAARGGEVGNG